MTESTAHRGLKRKRPSADVCTNYHSNCTNTQGPCTEYPGDKVTGKTGFDKKHHTLREVKKAAKKVKTFETQKLVKKFKESDKTEITDLERQLNAFKRIDLDNFAIVSLRNRLKKDRILATNSTVDHFTEKELTVYKPDVEAASAEGKVWNKLMSSKIFSSEMNSLMEGLRAILQPGEVDIGAGGEGAEPDTKQKKPARVGREDWISKDEIDDTGSVREHQHEGAQEVMSGTNEESRSIVTNREDDDDGWESGSIDTYRDVHHVGGERKGEGDFAYGPSSDSDSAESDIAVDVPTNSNHASSSTFLPSLSVGFIRGGSDSDDFSDGESKLADGVKKNRRGQRARQAIWEKKYGRGAKHLAKQREVEKQKYRSDRDNRGDQPGPASGRHSRTHPVKFQPPTALDSGYPSRSMNTTTPSTSSSLHSAKRIRTEKLLHPSWEAKKKLKEKQKAAILPSEGKKIIF